jgi:anti-sigma B factor antagonist
MATTLSAGRALRVEVAERGDVRVVKLSGRLDESFEKKLAKTLGALLERNQVRVVVDLGEWTSFNSRGASAFIATVDALREAGGDLKIAGLPSPAKLVPDRRIQQFESVDEAVEAFKVPIRDVLSNGALDVYVTTPRGKTFHASGCATVKRLKSVKVLTSKKAARDAGLKPCSRCAST